MFATFGTSWCLGCYNISSWKVGCPEPVVIWSYRAFLPHLVASILWYLSSTFICERHANRPERMEKDE